MQGAYGGLVIIMIYGTGVQEVEEDDALITDNGLFILTDNSDEILV